MFVGVDWATEQHQICVVDDEGGVVCERQVTHSGDGIAESPLVIELREWSLMTDEALAGRLLASFKASARQRSHRQSRCLPGRIL